MIDFLLDTNLFSGLILFVFSTVLFGLTVYLGAHALIKGLLKKKHERMGRVLFRVSASLLALILSITFANQRVDFFKISDSIESEASAIVDLKLDLDLFGTEEADNIETKLRKYVFGVSIDGWQSLKDNPFKSKSIVLFREIYTDLNSLSATTPLQEKLKAGLLEDVDRISDYLQVRLFSFNQKSSPLIYISVFGLLVCMILFTVYPPDWITVGFLMLYVAFIGIVLYFILMMSNPLKGPLQIEPGPFLLLKEAIESSY